jgi:hypothetical protein
MSKIRQIFELQIKAMKVLEVAYKADLRRMSHELYINPKLVYEIQQYYKVRINIDRAISERAFQYYATLINRIKALNEA